MNDLRPMAQPQSYVTEIPNVTGAQGGRSSSPPRLTSSPPSKLPGRRARRRVRSPTEVTEEDVEKNSRTCAAASPPSDHPPQAKTQTRLRTTIDLVATIDNRKRVDSASDVSLRDPARLMLDGPGTTALRGTAGERVLHLNLEGCDTRAKEAEVTICKAMKTASCQG